MRLPFRMTKADPEFFPSWVSARKKPGTQSPPAPTKWIRTPASGRKSVPCRAWPGAWRRRRSRSTTRSSSSEATSSTRRAERPRCRTWTSLSRLKTAIIAAKIFPCPSMTQWSASIATATFSSSADGQRQRTTQCPTSKSTTPTKIPGCRPRRFPARPCSVMQAPLSATLLFTWTAPTRT